MIEDLNGKMVSAFQCYELYLSLKNHFSKDSYDFFKYDGKTRTKPATFEKRRDRFWFQKLSKKYTEREDIIGLIVSNILCNNCSWIGDLLDDEAETNYNKFQKRNQSLSYIFTEEIDRLFTEHGPIKTFRTEDIHEYPPIIVSGISPETLVIVNDLVDLVSMYDKKYSATDVIWESKRRIISKYSRFVNYDRSAMKKIFVNKIREYTHD